MSSKALCDASLYGDVSEVRKYIEQGADVNYRDWVIQSKGQLQK